MADDLRARLRALDSAPDAVPAFAPEAAGEDPYDLVLQWLGAALDAGVRQPTAMSLSTSSADGATSSRFLVLKDVTRDQGSDGFWFASMADSRKGREITANPRVALAVFWREQARQIRVVGTAIAGTRDQAIADFAARGAHARASAAAWRQSDEYPDEDCAERATLEATDRVTADPRLTPAAWTAYRVVPSEIEFWQSPPAAPQLRLRYTRTRDGWRRLRLWP